MAAETSANAKAYKTAVIKIGSNTLTDDEGKCDRAYLADLAHQVARVRREGWRVIIVSSGAIPCGLEALGLPLRPRRHAHRAGCGKRWATRASCGL